MHKFNTLAFLLVATLGSGGARAEFVDRTCFGNLETFDRQIIKAGISYKLSYLMSGESAKVRFCRSRIEREGRARESVDRRMAETDG
jgi:hypothetical protein